MKKARGSLVFALFLTGTLGLLGCSGGKTAEHAAPVSKAMAVLHAIQGSGAEGSVTFSKEKDGIRVVAQVVGLKPGLHGFHVHEFGDCSPPDARNAGDHFNPSKAPHGGPTGDKRHAGDMGNIEAGANGVGKYDAVIPHLTFEGPGSIIGRSVIVHALPDDLSTQPTGGAGARISCGVIGIVK